MGSTTYCGNTTEEALAIELSGCEVLDRSGRWFLWKNQHGYVGLTYFIVRRDQGDPNIKEVDIEMGTGRYVPRRLAKKYLEHWGGMDNIPNNARPDIERAFEPRPKTPVLKVGDKFNVTKSHWTYTFKTVEGSEQVPFQGTFTYLGGFRARWEGRGHVRLPKQWRTHCTWDLAD